MKMYIFILVIFSILSSCNRKAPLIVTFNLKPTRFIETIEVTGTVQAVSNNAISTPRVYSGLKVAYLAKDGDFVKKGDTICIIDAPDIMKTFEQLNIDLKKMEGEKRSIEAENAMQLSILEAQAATNNAQMQITMLDSIQLKFAPPVKQRLLSLEMEKVQIEKKKIEKKLASQKIIDNSELSQIGSRIMMQNNQIQMFKAQINSLKIIAPSDGYVMHVENPTFYFGSGSTIGGKIEEGSLVFQGMALLQIPDISKMQVSVEVSEADYKRINNNQKVLIEVESASNLKTTGKVARKSLANKNKEEKSLIKTYEVIVSVDSCHLKMKPGISASCKIFINDLRDSIVIPAAALFTKDSTKIVYVSEQEKFIPVAVETGLSNSSEIIVSKGLRGHETIALIEPPKNLIANELKSKPDTIKFQTIKADSVLKKSAVSRYEKNN